VKRLADALKLAGRFAASLALVEAGLGFQEIGKVSREVPATAAEANGLAKEPRKAASAVFDYSRQQTKQFLDPRNRKALDAGLQALAVFNGTGRLINREVIPRAMTVPDNFSNATASLDRAIQATDKSVHADLLPESKRLLTGTAEAVVSAGRSADAASAQILRAGNDIHAILSNPALRSILTETNKWLLFSTDPIQDDAGKVIGAVHVGREHQ
jgi:hypothetical protein